MKDLLFFLGKGGVGKTTLATAIACQLAARGSSVLIVSLDPAHNLGDVCGKKLSNKPENLQTGLSGLEIDLSYWIDRYLEESRQEILSAYSQATVFNVDSFIKNLKYAPGSDEYAVLWAIEYIRRTYRDQFEVIVFDTPPTALTLKFLAMPSLSLKWVMELSRMRELILKKRQTILRINPEASVIKGVLLKEEDKIYLRLSSMQSRLHALSDILTKKSYYTVVMNPDELSFCESLRIREVLESLDIRLNSICLNKEVSDNVHKEKIIKGFKDLPVFSTRLIAAGIQNREGLTELDMSGVLSHLFQDS